MSNPVAVCLAVVLLLLNAFFVGAEFALISARRSAVEPVAQSGSTRAQTTLRAMEDVSLMLAGAQLGITICTLGLGSLGEPAVAHLLDGPFASVGLSDAPRHLIAFAASMIIVVFLHVVIGEMVPKNIALAGPDRSALLLVPPLVGVVRCLRPAIVGLNMTANLSLRLLRVAPRDEVASAFTRDEVAAFVEESRREGLLDADQHGLLSGVLYLDERNARSVLLPVDRLETVPAGATPRDVEALAARTGFSRFPVQDSSGALTGYLHLKDVLETNPGKRSAPIPAKWVRPLARVGVDDRLQTVLSTMQRSGAHLARVTDRDGTILGVVALEDVLEELVGDIRDEDRPSSKG